MPTDAERIRALTRATESLAEVEKRHTESVDDLHEAVDELRASVAQRIFWVRLTAAASVVLVILFGAGFTVVAARQDRITDCIKAGFEQANAGLIARAEAADEAGRIAVDAHNQMIRYLDRLGGFLDLVQLSGVKGVGADSATQEYRRAITDLRREEVRLKDAQEQSNRTRNANRPTLAPACV